MQSGGVRSKTCVVRLSINTLGCVGCAACVRCSGCRQWVNYFLHSGHLEIEGLKMSKSLKNFITIRWGTHTVNTHTIHARG